MSGQTRLRPAVFPTVQHIRTPPPDAVPPKAGEAVVAYEVRTTKTSYLSSGCRPYIISEEEAEVMKPFRLDEFIRYGGRPVLHTDRRCGWRIPLFEPSRPRFSRSGSSNKPRQEVHIYVKNNTTPDTPKPLPGTVVGALMLYESGNTKEGGKVIDRTLTPDEVRRMVPFRWDEFQREGGRIVTTDRGTWRLPYESAQ